MKKQAMILGAFMALMGATKANAQINLGEKALGAISTGLTALTFSDADAAAMAKTAVFKLDSTNVVAPATDGYAMRLSRVFGPHSNLNGMTLNYKVYKTKEINAFACADGSVRVYSGLMDVMDDNQLLAVIGHEIGHVANHHTRDAMKRVYTEQFAVQAAASQSSKVADRIAKLSNDQWIKLANAIVDSKYSRKQEIESDVYAYNFLKTNKYNVNAEEAAFTILGSMSGQQANFIDALLSSHPDPMSRANDAKARAQKDGLYKPYVQGAIVNTPPAPKAAVKTTTTKKTTTAKKTTTTKKK